MAENTKEREELEKLLEAINDASRNARAAFLTFLLAGLYFAIVIGSTTDEQLLRAAGITMPLLNIKLPIVGFYIIAPWLFWLLHLNLLLLLRLLAGKIDRLPMRLPETFRHRLHTFPFTQARAGPRQAGATRFLLWAMAWISMVALPTIVLMWAQARFLAYHSDLITASHQSAVLADLVLLWLLWPRTVGSKALAKVLGYGVNISLSLLLAAFSLFDAVVPGGPWENLVRRTYEGLVRRPYPGNLLEAVFDDKFRNLDLAEKTLVLEEASPEILAAYIASKRDGEMEAARLEHTRGLDLHDRDLRNANLSKARLDKADLREAKLQGANLSEAKLQDADLSGAKLQGANLFLAKLQGAALRQAKLQGAVLRQAKLQGAILRGAKLQGAILRWAELQGADLLGAKLQAADLSKVKLQGAILRGAKLQGADLRWAKLQAADLRWAELQGAALRGAELQGANLRWASLDSARLVNVDFRSAYLWDVNFNKYMPDEWTKLKDEVAAAAPAGVKRKNALERIGEAMKSETAIRPKSAEGAIYDPRVPELADLPKQWLPLDRGAYRPSEFRLGILTGIACNDENAAAGIARRAIKIAPFDDPHLAGALLEQECQAIWALPEGLQAKLRKAAEGADKP